MNKSRMKKILLLLIAIVAVSCQKEDECGTLLSYGGSPSDGDVLTAHYSDGTIIKATKDDLPFPETSCEEPIDYCECTLFTRIYNGEIGYWEFNRTFLITLKERCDKYNQEIKHLWRDKLIWEMNRRFFFDEDASSLAYQGLKNTKYNQECKSYE